MASQRYRRPLTQHPGNVTKDMSFNNFFHDYLLVNSLRKIRPANKWEKKRHCLSRAARFAMISKWLQPLVQLPRFPAHRFGGGQAWRFRLGPRNGREDHPRYTPGKQTNGWTPKMMGLGRYTGLVVLFIFSCSPPLGEMIQCDQYFLDGLKPPTSISPFKTWLFCVAMLDFRGVVSIDHPPFVLP